MPQRKKVLNKENCFPVRRTTFHQINYTEQLRIPTGGTLDLKNVAKSIDLKKQPNKKPVSRKSRCCSVKQPNIQQPLRYKHLIRQFKQLKLVQEKSSSKSPVSCKSKSKSKAKKQNKKTPFSTLRTNPHSEITLTHKLEKTIKKINEKQFLKEEEELYPVNSSADTVTRDERKKYEIVEPQHDLEINFRQLRQFCSNVEMVHKRRVSMLIGNEHEYMATKIQRAWKRYRTRKLIQKNVKMFADSLVAESNSNFISLSTSSQNLGDIRQRSDIVIQSQQLYEQQDNQHKVTYISNFEESDQQRRKSETSQISYEEVITKIKLQELRKWDDIISMISVNKSSNPVEIQKLLAHLANQSEINKKDLESKSNILLEFSQRKNRERTFLGRSSRGSQSRNSQGSELSSKRDMEYDSKKYIEYLDGDLLLFNRDRQSPISSQSESARGKISGRKQQLLRAQLLLQASNNLQEKLSHCSSWKNLDQVQQEHPSKKIEKVRSEKYIKQTLISLSPTSDFGIQEEDEINLELLTKQFLEGTNPLENFDQLQSEDVLKLKLAELNQLRKDEDFPEGESWVSSSNEREEKQKQKQNELIDSIDNEPVLSRNNEALHRMKIESVEHNISSEEDEDDQNELSEEFRSSKSENAESVSIMVFNNLLFEFLKDIAKYETSILNSFKKFSLSRRLKSSRTQNHPHRTGFPSNFNEIKQFVQNIIQYLLEGAPEVFKNLEVASGPSVVEMLKYMHPNAQDELIIDEEEDESNVMVIPNWVFDKFWQKKCDTIANEVPQNNISERYRQNFEYLKGLNKIFYRSLFDAFNQCLDYQRNYGQFGKPFPWKKSPVFFHNKSQADIQKSIDSAQRRMLQISMTYCGIIIEKDEITGVHESEEYLQQVLEDRLSKMLASDLLEAEEKWVFYEDDETQILVEIANDIAVDIMMEASLEITRGRFGNQKLSVRDE